MNTIKIMRWNSPAGEMLLGSFNGMLCLCDWASNPHRERTDNRLKNCFNAEFKEEDSYVAMQTIRQLKEYFEGKRTEFDVPICYSGTEFQNQVWSALRKVPYGKTISYATLALRMGDPKATRAVAAASANNPISIIIPCHRVIGSDGSLTGYAGGIDIKHMLLSIESIHLPM